jgi:Protein of unknown function (DUF1194)
LAPLRPRSRLGRLVGAAMLAVAAPAAPAAAMVDWLVLLVDASGSIDGWEYDLQREAYVGVLRDPGIAALLRGAQITIVEFAETPQVIVDWTGDPRAAADAYALHERRNDWPGPASTTGIARALALALDLLEGRPGRRVIDISGDGPDNVDWVAAVWSQRDRARELRIEINGLAIPTAEEPAIDRYYAENVVNGFLEVSREHADFERSLRSKMSLEIAGYAEG